MKKSKKKKKSWMGWFPKEYHPNMAYHWNFVIGKYGFNPNCALESYGFIWKNKDKKLPNLKKIRITVEEI